MTVETLIGCRVWVKVHRFQSVSGIILAVHGAPNLADLRDSIAGITVLVSLPGGDVIEVCGSNILKFDRAVAPQADPVAA
jgi:hypothetical protein